MPVTLSSASEVAEAIDEELLLEDWLEFTRVRQTVAPGEDPCPVGFDAFSAGLPDLFDRPSPYTGNSSGEEEGNVNEPGSTSSGEEEGNMNEPAGTSSGEEEEIVNEPQRRIYEHSVPGPCSYLSVGQSFHGTQRMSSSRGRVDEDWEVVVRIQVSNLLPVSVYY
eukprot:gene15118-21175_t